MGKTFCLKCFKEFSCSKSLRRHQKSVCWKKKGTCFTNFKCPKCLKYFSNEYNKNRHLKNSCQFALDSPIKESEHKKTINITLKEEAKSRRDKRKQIILPKIEKKKSQPIINKNTYDKFVIGKIGDDIMKIIFDKFGKEKGMDFLLENFLAAKYNKIIDECYINGHNSDQFPVACRGNEKKHFRFLDNNKMLINDPTGEIVVNTIINNIQNAVLRANNILIKQYVDSRAQESLYDDYDIRKIQECLCNINTKTNRNKIRKFLGTRVLNSSHSFFDEQNNSINLGIWKN